MSAITQITTKETVKSFLGITVSTYDTLLSTLCDWLTSYVEGYTGRKFTDATIVDEIYNSKDFKFSFFLNNSPITSITKIEKKQSDGTWKLLVADVDYEVNLRSGFVRMFETDDGISDIRVGYSISGASIPKEIEMVATEMVSRVFNKRNSEGVIQESLGEASIQWGSQMSDNEKQILDNYRRCVNIIA